MFSSHQRDTPIKVRLLVVSPRFASPRSAQYKFGEKRTMPRQGLGTHDGATLRKLLLGSSWCAEHVGRTRRRTRPPRRSRALCRPRFRGHGNGDPLNHDGCVFSLTKIPSLLSILRRASRFSVATTAFANITSSARLGTLTRVSTRPPWAARM